MAGVYVHIPFCRRKCLYCDFYSRPPADAGEIDRFAAALIYELELRAAGARGRSVRLCAQTNTCVGTVYFGGGTPSMLGADTLRRILRAIRERLSVAALAEITVEANPLDVTADWSARCLDAGVNRLSIGVQSLDEGDLRFLGRLHHADDGPRAVKTARDAGFREVGIDLIYGLHGQSADALRDSINRAVEVCRPEHISCYQLTYAAGTPLGRDVEAGRIPRLHPDEEYELFVAVHRRLAELGYPAYEVSNFSLGDAHRSRHNSNYWRHVPYVGLGPSAHSFEPPVRSWNLASTEKYCSLVEQGRLPVAGSEALSQEQLAAEMVMLALRTTDGLDLELYRRRFGRDFADANRDALRDAVSCGRITMSECRIRPTLDGLAVADALAAEFN